MESADPRHPRHRAIDQLTTSIAQAEEAVVRYRLAMQQQSQNGSDLSRASANTIELSPDFVDLASPRPELSFPCKASLFARRKTDALCQRYWP